MFPVHTGMFSSLSPHHVILTYSFTAPAEMLLIICFEKNRNAIIIGSTEIAIARYVAPIFAAISVEAFNEPIITGNVNLLGDNRTTNGKIYEFQAPINVPIDIVAIPGIIIGTAILWKIANSLAPSIRAASTIVFGKTDCKYWRKKKTTNGLAIAGIIKGI